MSASSGDSESSESEESFSTRSSRSRVKEKRSGSSKATERREPESYSRSHSRHRERRKASRKRHKEKSAFFFVCQVAIPLAVAQKVFQNPRGIPAINVIVRARNHGIVLKNGAQINFQHCSRVNPIKVSEL